LYKNEHILTPSQKQAAESIDSFLKNDSQHCFILKGYAGTGKTYLIGKIAREILQAKRNVVLLAPTGRAARVLQNKTDLNARTIHSHIYSPTKIGLEANDDKESILKYRFERRDNEDTNDTVYFIDEASMISDIKADQEMISFGSGRLLSDVLEYIGWDSKLDRSNHSRKIIFVGDPIQLPPVQGCFSPALSEEYIQKEKGLSVSSYALTDIVRQQQESGIVQNSMEIRKSVETQDYRTLQVQAHHDVSHIRDRFIDRWSSAIHQKNIDSTIVITATNKAALDYNIAIRDSLWNKEHEGPLKGDRVLCVTNNYKHKILNGELLTVLYSSPTAETRAVYFKGRKEPVTLLFRAAKLQFIDLTNNEASSLDCMLLENALMSPARTTSLDVLVALRLEFEKRRNLKYPSQNKIPDVTEFRKLKDQYLLALQEDIYFNAIHIKYGYALTCYKAQGGEWDNVFVDFKSSFNQRNEHYFRWAYTAMTRAKRMLYTINAPNFGIFSTTDSGIVLDAPPHAVRSVDLVHPVEEEQTFTDLLKQRIYELCNSAEIELDELIPMPYRVRAALVRKQESVKVDIIFNGKNRITNIVLKGNKNTSFDNEVLDLLSVMNGTTLKVLSQSREFVPSFSSEQGLQADIYSEVKKRLTDKIIVTGLEHHNYRERYTFRENRNIACIDFLFNGMGVITSIEEKPVYSNSSEFLRKLSALFEMEE